MKARKMVATRSLYTVGFLSLGVVSLYLTGLGVSSTYSEEIILDRGRAIWHTIDMELHEQQGIPRHMVDEGHEQVAAALLVLATLMALALAGLAFWLIWF